MSRLSRRIRECEAAIGVDRRNMAAAVAELRAGARRHISRPSVLCAFFGGGLALGWVSGRRKPSYPASSAAASPLPAPVRASMMRIVRDVLWPVGMGALQVQLNRWLVGSDSQRR